jgi:hypothetical protein
MRMIPKTHLLQPSHEGLRCSRGPPQLAPHSTPLARCG